MLLFLVYFLSLVVLGGVSVSWHRAQLAGRQHSAGAKLLYCLVSVIFICTAFLALRYVLGTEYAVFLSLFHISWLAWIFIGFQGRVKTRSKPVKTVTSVPAEASFLYKLGVVFLAGPVALLASIMLSLLLSRLLIEELANQWVLTFMLVPVIWGALATWFAADRLLLRPVLVTFVISLISLWVLL
jgi:hypothetical protein